MIDATNQWLSFVFEMKDMGEVKYVLVVKIVKNQPKKLRSLCQEAYIKRLLKIVRMY